jgi:hypothetical protein
VAPTKQMVIFLASMENAAEIKDTSDQRLWNTVQRHFVFQQLSWRLLPQEVIYKYRCVMRALALGFASPPPPAFPD